MEDEPTVGQAVYYELSGLDPEPGQSHSSTRIDIDYHTLLVHDCSLTEDSVVVVDEIIRRLLNDHGSGWARQGRIEGDKGGSWIITVTGPDFEGALYWDYHNDAEVILVALVVH